MIAYFMIASGFPVVAVSMMIMVYPFLVGLLLTDWVAAIFGVFNSIYRSIVGFIESFIPFDWMFGARVDHGNGSISYEDPTPFYQHFWMPLSDFRLPTYDDIAVVGWFMAIMWILEIYLLVKLLKRRVQGGGSVPEVAPDSSILGKKGKDGHYW